MTLQVDGVGARHGETPVLRDVHLACAPGEVLAVLGPSGSGKSTLLRVVAGLHPATAGRVLLGGRDVTGVPPEQRRVGLVPQDGALFSHLTVAANAAFGLRVPRRRAAGHPRVREVLELVGLGDLGARMPHELSGGQQQRVAVARALAPHPQLVLLDEPFSALDAGLRTHVREEVVGALRAAGVAALLVTHDQEEALSLADRVAVLRDGALVQVARPRELWERPADAWTAGFLGGAVVLPATRTPTDPHGLVVRTAVGDLRLARPAPGRGPLTVVVRPEQVGLAAPRAGRRDGAETHAVVTSVRYLGHGALVHVQPQAQPGAPATGPVPVRMGSSDTIPSVGESCCVEVRGTVHHLAARQERVTPAVDHDEARVVLAFRADGAARTLGP